MTTGFLAVSGASVRDGTGAPIALRGVNLGGWMNYEGFILGHPGTETLFRTALRGAIGTELYERFSERLLAAFYDEPDAAYLAGLGFNVMRIPVNYRHFEDDAAPFTLKPDGFRHLDRVIEANARHGIYSIVDLHAAQGWQNMGWHSDNPLTETLTWTHPHFQDRIAWLWREFATHFRDNPWVAGYNLLNEPEDRSRTRIGPFYGRLMREIREIDQHHLFFLDGNDWAHDFDELGSAADDVVYCVHQYPAIGEAGPVAYPGMRAGRFWDRAAIEQDFLGLTAWIRSHDAPILVGEFGPVDEGDREIYASRLTLMDDMTDIYRANSAGWTYWTYKDIGIAGIVNVNRPTPWLTRFGPQITKKRRLGADYWGTQPELAQEVLGSLGDLLAREFPEVGLHPWGTTRRAWNVVGEKLMSELLMKEFVDGFRGLTGDDLDALADSFRFDQCSPKPGLSEALGAAARSA